MALAIWERAWNLQRQQSCYNEKAYEKAHKDLADSSSTTQNYKNYLKYFEELFSISQCWTKWFQKDQLVRGSNTNNYVEAQFLVVKDTILSRQRQCIINQLLHNLIIEFENHFKQRLLRVAVEHLMVFLVLDLKDRLWKQLQVGSYLNHVNVTMF